MPMLNTVTEQELAVRAVAPRVSELDIEAEITSEHFFTAAQGDMKAQEDAAFATGARDGAQARPVPAPLSLLTICVLVLRNGFTVTGTSACASPANFDADIGKRLARRDAVRQLWPLLGYALRDRLHHAPAVQAAAAALDVSAGVCEGNAEIESMEGGNQNLPQAELLRANAVSYRAAIARLVP